MGEAVVATQAGRRLVGSRHRTVSADALLADKFAAGIAYCAG